MAHKPATSRHLGLDLGGTYVKSAVVERAADSEWRTIDREQIPTDAAAGPEAVVARLAEIGATAVRRHGGVESAGIGVPGPYDPDSGTVRDLTNFPGDWQGKALAGLVGDRLGVPVRLINDARAFGLAELRLGAGRGARSMVGATLGTGLGGVIAINGEVLQGHDGAAGELGHQTIDPLGPPCNCGSNGCLEVFVRADRLAEACGAPTAVEAIERARADDRAAVAGMAAVGRYLGIGLANVITLVTPDRVVIGGGIGTAAFELVIGPINDELRRRVTMTRLDRIEVVPAALGVWAGAIGAALHGAASPRR